MEKSGNVRQSLANAGAIQCPANGRRDEEGGDGRMKEERDVRCWRVEIILERAPSQGLLEQWRAEDLPIGLKLYVDTD